ncbi:MAG: hypothetical protein QXG05_02055 [Nitrososphaerota archaeon]
MERNYSPKEEGKVRDMITHMILVWGRQGREDQGRIAQIMNKDGERAT